MKRLGFLPLLLLVLFWTLTPDEISAQSQLAFPGASGYAQYVTGGRGGKVYYVTSLKDCSDDNLVPGTLRWALRAGDDSPRTILFAVNGTIYLESKLKTNHNNVSILGQSAPGGGICITGYPVYISSRNYIIRYLRFRAGEIPALEGSGNESYSGLDIENACEVILDHCSVTWSMEECLTMFDNDTTTVQNCIIGEGLYHSYNVKTTGETSGRAFAMQWGGDHSNMHHVLITNCNGRGPRFNGVREANAWLAGKDGKTYAHDCHIDGDFANNVFYNWGGSHLSFYGGEFYSSYFANAPADLNAYNRVYMRNNYYRPGPSTQKNGSNSRYFMNPSGDTDDKMGQWYLSGNKFETDSYYAPTGTYWTKSNLDLVNEDNTYGFDSNEKFEARALNLGSTSLRNHIIDAIPNGVNSGYTPISADQAYKEVTDSQKGAGACLPRYDEEDQRLVDEAGGRRDGTTPFIGSRAMNASQRPGIIDRPEDVTFVNGTDTVTTLAGNTYNCYPSLALQSGEKYAIDSDADGMPDAYEEAMGFNKQEASDGSAISGNGYSNLENYLNALADYSISNSSYQTSDTYVEPGISTRPETVTISFEANSSIIEGVAPSPITIPYGGSISFSNTHSFYREGYSMTGWNDGSMTYLFNQDYSGYFIKDVTLKPTMQLNDKNLSDRTSDIEITWDMTQSYAPQLAEGTKGIYTTTADIDGTKIDVRMAYDGLKLTLPSADGSVAIVTYADGTSQNFAAVSESLTITLSKDSLQEVKITLPFIADFSGKTFHSPSAGNCIVGTTDYQTIENGTERTWPADTNVADAKNFNATAAKDYELIYGNLSTIHSTDWMETIGQERDAYRNVINPNGDDFVRFSEDEITYTHPIRGFIVGKNDASAQMLYAYVKDCSRVRTYAAGTSSKGDYMQVIAIPADNSKRLTSNTLHKLFKSGSFSEYFDLDLDPSQSYRLEWSSVGGMDMMVGAIKLFKDGSQEKEDKQRHNFTTTVSPAGAGVVTQSPKGTAFVADAEISLSATAATGFQFENWTDADGNLLSTDASFTYTMPDAETTITANFKDLSKSDIFTDGPFQAIVSNADELQEALAAATQSTADRYYIFLRNGEYDFGNKALTAVPQNTSLIGESQEGVLLFNTPSADVTDYQNQTPVLFIDQNQNDVYMQDLTIRAGRDWEAKTSQGQALALRQRGKKAIYKNVTLQGVQDTYYLNKADASAYFEDCKIAGDVDFIYGDGTMFFEHCTLQPVSSSACITAPNTQAGYMGIVFNDCTIEKEPTAKDAVTGYRLGRPWGDSPASTFINTTMKVLPADAGWGSMASNLVVRFHEYGSKDANGNILDLSNRSIADCKAASGSDEPVLTATQAAEYTVANVFQKVAADWNPASYTEQLEAPAIQVNAEQTLLSWSPVAGAYCYAICRNGSVIAFTSDTSYPLTIADGQYTLRVANQRGGLGQPSAAVSALSTLQQDSSESIIYDIQGRRVKGALKPGLYIINGKKANL